MKKFILFQTSSKNKEKILPSYPLEREKEYVIGRNPETSQICIDHFSLSRIHAKIKVAAGGSATLQDLESKNGTFVDGKRIGPNKLILLRAGTELKFGELDDNFIIREFLDETVNQNEILTEKSERTDKFEKIRKRSRSRSQEKKKERKDYNEKKENSNDKKELIQTKRSLLWSTKTDEKKINNLSSISAQTLSGSEEDRLKFLKLMGVKNTEEIISKSKKDESTKQKINNLQHEQETIQEDLEKQFNSGMQRKDGRKVGLGYMN